MCDVLCYSITTGGPSIWLPLEYVLWISRWQFCWLFLLCRSRWKDEDCPWTLPYFLVWATFVNLEHIQFASSYNHSYFSHKRSCHIFKFWMSGWFVLLHVYGIPKNYQAIPKSPKVIIFCIIFFCTILLLCTKVQKDVMLYSQLLHLLCHKAVLLSVLSLIHLCVYPFLLPIACILPTRVQMQWVDRCIWGTFWFHSALCTFNHVIQEARFVMLVCSLDRIRIGQDRIRIIIVHPIPMCVWVFLLHQAILGYQLDILQFNSILTLSTWDSISFHRLRAQSHKAAPLLPFQTLYSLKPRLSSVLLNDALQIRDPLFGLN